MKESQAKHGNTSVTTGQRIVAQADQLIECHCSFAASEYLSRALVSCSEPDVGVVSDALGMLLVRQGKLQEALSRFLDAASVAQDELESIRYRVHAALAHARLAQHDRAHRLLTSLLPLPALSQPSRVRMQVRANLAFVQSHNEFYEQALYNSELALQDAMICGDRTAQARLHTNLGYLHIELGEYSKAQSHLLRALSELDSPPLQTITELCRVSLLEERLDDSFNYAAQAVKLVWSSILDFEREEIARLFTLLAHLTYYSGDRVTALRLLEKSQLLFGQMSMWSQWKSTGSLYEQWNHHPSAWTGQTSLPQVDLDTIREFLLLFDAMNAQELTFREFSSLTDARVETVQALCAVLELTDCDRENVIYAARFADYGLTALERDVVLHPTRSPSSWEQYQSHPDLGVRMLQVAGLPPAVFDMVRDHHEHWDGTGFPRGKSANALSLGTYVLSVADHYASQIVLSNRTHSEALRHVSRLAGTVLSPTVVGAFVNLCRDNR